MDSSLWPVVWLLVGAFLLHRVSVVVYRLFFHPLSKFPGPTLYAASHLPSMYQNKVTGTFVKKMLSIHQRYGPIVRISPDQLAIEGSIGWPDVFSRRPNVPEFEKTPTFYGPRTGIGILPAQHDAHQRQRRLMAYAFSAAALTEQESYLTYYADLLMKRLRERMLAGEPVDMSRWYNYLTFDIIGELAFADPFYCLEKSDYHPLVAMIFSGIRANARMAFFEQFPILRPFTSLIANKGDMEKRQEYYKMARVKTEKRMALETDTRKDFMTYILRHNKDGTGMTREEIFANARTLIGAGSHTTASALAGLTFYLTQYPQVYSRLAEEIRSSFSSEDDINMKATAALPYLQACLEEALRMYPPLAETPPRVSPGAFVNGQYIPQGTSVSVFQWAANHSPQNFKDPECFAPERWLPITHPFYDPRYASDNKEASKPFAAGPRDCLGKYLAYAEMRLVVARLLWNFDIELLDGQEGWVSRQRVYIVYEKGPLMIQLKQRASF